MPDGLTSIGNIIKNQTNIHMNKLYLNPRLFVAFVLTFLLCFHINANAYQLMSTNFYIVGPDGTPTLKDGNMTIYDSPYSNGIDWHDGEKLSNGGENFGIIRYGASLAVERRQLVDGADTAYFNMWGMQIRNYRFELTMENFNPITQSAYVYDNYLNSIQPVDFMGLTTVNFSVTDTPSMASNRFKVIYTTPAEYNVMMSSMFRTLPVNFTGIQAIKKGRVNLVNWQVENEVSVQDYVVENSTDGRNFLPVGRLAANNLGSNHQYHFSDKTGIGADYYRIRANSNDSKTFYSKTITLKVEEVASTLSIVTNPVLNKQVRLKLNQLKATGYTVSLVYPGGKMIALKSISVSYGEWDVHIELPASAAPGIYQLRLVATDNTVMVKSIVLL